jgi:hypothetical protein
MKRLLMGLALVIAVVLASIPTFAQAKSLGGCPQSATESWQLVTVESLGIPEEIAVGIASLDGNRDGFTCIMPNPASASAPIAGSLVFRDNTVGA